MLKNIVNPQLTLPFGHSVSTLQKHLEEQLKRPVSLVFTENSTTMLSARVQEGTLAVRLHRMFLHAESGVLDEIAAYLKNRRGAMPQFRRFVREHRAELNAKPPKRVAVKTAGKHHDLRELYETVNREYFSSAITSAITWGSRSPRSAVRKRTLGSYSERANLIRISPVLDKKNIPSYFVAFIVYHEMLHAALGTPLKGKRRSVHSREFRKREKLFHEYDRAMAWERGEGRGTPA